MKQNTLFINCFSRRCSNPAFSKFTPLTFLMLTSPSQYLWPIPYPKSSFQQMPWLSLTFLFYLIKIIPFGSSSILIHDSSNDPFSAGFFYDFTMQNFLCPFSWNHQLELSPMDRSIFLPDQLTNTGSFLPVCISLKYSFIFMSTSKCSIKSTVLDNIVGPTVGTGLWLTATNIHNPFHRILHLCNSLIAIFDIESRWETFPRIMYMRIEYLTWQNPFRVREDWIHDNFDKNFNVSIHVVT